MQHLNYCRQIASTCAAMLGVPNVAREQSPVWLHMLALCRASQKFLLPENGELIDDPELRALDADFEIRLPHPFLALEYQLSGAYGLQGDGTVLSKDVVFAWEVEDNIIVQRVSFSRHQGAWGIGNSYMIPRVGFLRESASGFRQFKYSQFFGGVAPDNEEMEPNGISRLLYFLNALACSNVKVERSEASKVHKAMRKKGALPFDDYHILTIDVPGGRADNGLGAGSHRSPREHLRRGHIRRLQDGRKLWVNATVVNPGVGGKVTKDYAVRAAA
jgi:hypothetical protein